MKNAYGKHRNVFLSDAEYQGLISERGEEQTNAAIEYLSEYIQRKDYKIRSHWISIRRWVFKALEEQLKRAIAH